MSTDICTEDVIVQITSPQGGTTANVTGRLNPGSNGSDLGRKLLLAAKNGDTNNVLSLMAAGAPFSTDWLGTSALHLAAGAGHADTAAVLLRAGAVRDARTKVDRTPLHVAAGGGHTDVVKLLLQHGALVDCRDMLRMCPLHWAARRGQAGAAAALLAAGADRSAADKFGLRPADLAARAGHRALAALLRPGPHEKTAKPPDPPTFETVPKLQEITITSIPEAKKAKLNPPIEEMKIKPEPEIEGGDSEQGADTSEVPGAAWSLDAGAALLARHGITLLPRDHPHTVLAALRAGRTLVLSDAGKLLLKEAASATNLDLPAPPPPAPPAAPAPAPAPTPTHNLQNKIIFTPANIGDMQIKYVQVPREAAPASPSVEAAPARPRPVLLNYNVRAAAPPAPAPAAGRQPVKIIMNKANFKKLIANKNAAAAHAQLAAPAPGPAPSSEAASLRAELAAARAAVSQLTQELARTKQLLARRDL